MSKSCEMTWENHCLIAKLSGEVDHHLAEELRRCLDEAILQGIDRMGRVDLIFDFRDVSFMDSSGIGVVMGRYNKIHETGGQVYVTGCEPYVDSILELSGIYLITRRKVTVQEALEESRGRAEEAR